MPLQMQAALEEAVADAIRQGLGYQTTECQRCFDGRPHPRAGKVFVAVWSDGSRRSQSRVALDEVLGVKVTATIRLELPFDRWLEHRDDLETRINAIRALVHKDSLDHVIKAAANVLADYGSAADKHVGFAEALAFLDLEPWHEVGGEWFHASQGKIAGIAQTATFGRARRIQHQLTEA